MAIIGKSGGHINSGRKPNEDTVKVTTTVELKVRDKAKKNHGTYSNALRFAAENKPNKN